VIFPLLDPDPDPNLYADPDPDPPAQINADPDTDPDPKPCLLPFNYFSGFLDFFSVLVAVQWIRIRWIRN
jgi:hypothetical protein